MLTTMQPAKLFLSPDLAAIAIIMVPEGALLTDAGLTRVVPQLEAVEEPLPVLVSLLLGGDVSAVQHVVIVQLVEVHGDSGTFDRD